MKTISRKRTALILAGLLALTAPLSWVKAKPAVEEPPSVQNEQTKQEEYTKQEYETQWMSFPEGGFEAIQKNLIYPKAARKAGLEGTVTVEVLYTEKGFKSASIKESSFEPGKDLGCHQAALDAVKSVRWGKIKNAKEAGGHVDVPLLFMLNQANTSEEAETVIRGIIRDKESNNLLPGTKVELKGTEFSCIADEKAEFYMDGIPKGTYEILFTLDGRLIGSMPLLVSSADTWNLEMTLDMRNPVNTRFGKIYGKVTDKEGNPLVATNIVLKGTKIGAAADQSGDFWIINVPPGIYTLQASHIGYKSILIQDVKVAVNESEEVNIQLEEGVINMTMAAPSETEEAAAPPPSDDEKFVFIPYDSPPQPIGGFDAIQKNLRYPELARKAGIEGRVILNIQVDEKGDIIQTKVIQSLGGNNGCDEAAVVAVKSVKWKPAQQRDQLVKVWIAVPIDFKLENNSNSK